MATLGINPSRLEFYSSAGVLLTGYERRLATSDSLGAAPVAYTLAQTTQASANLDPGPSHDIAGPLPELAHTRRIAPSG